jgi:hypothetical protein
MKLIDEERYHDLILGFFSGDIKGEGPRNDNSLWYCVHCGYVPSYSTPNSEYQCPGEMGHFTYIRNIEFIRDSPNIEIRRHGRTRSW